MDFENNEKAEIMTLRELARYLKITEDAALHMAVRGEIPAIKIADEWRFMRTIIDDWLAQKMNYPPKSALVQMLEQAEIILPLSRLIRPEHMVLALVPGTAEETVRQLVQPLDRTKTVLDSEAFIRMIIEREALHPTVIGNGVAIPHARETAQCPVKEACIVLGVCKEGTRFDPSSGTKTHLFFLVGTNSDIVHLKIMSKLAFLVKNEKAIGKIIEAKNEKEILSALIRVDQDIIINES